MNKITIVMTYYNRQKQLNKTLESFLKYDPESFNVVIVDDCSPQLIEFREYPFEITTIKMEHKSWIQNDPAWNTALSYAKNEIIIIQNAECYHAGDILSYAKRVTDESYITFGCYSLGEGEDINTVKFNNRNNYFDGESAWYNHPVYNPRAHHFCAAITRTNMIKINGFDERFSYGLGFDDDYLLHQVKCLGLKVEITSFPFVFHQWHYDNSQPANKAELVELNRNLYHKLIKENNYRAVHLLTPDL